MSSTELSRGHVVFAAAMAMETAHLLDDGLLQPHDGADIPATLASVAIAVGAVAVFGRLPTWAKAVLAALFGLAGLVGGLDMHVLRALEEGAGGSDYSGFGHAAAGLVLLALAMTLSVTRADRRPVPR